MRSSSSRRTAEPRREPPISAGRRPISDPTGGLERGPLIRLPASCSNMLDINVESAAKALVDEAAARLVPALQAMLDKAIADLPAAIAAELDGLTITVSRRPRE